ncbi:unnamed protein product [Nesidiocoris tenuis]|uniref:Uncharacterized protein n=1 Tax=Nesidiocoris tenuis TaxID=355587 RepID=A0A6H5HSS7_9HEMI|nr:unnamed protein product [Nesidiocoris tenuis]
MSNTEVFVLVFQPCAAISYNLKFDGVKYRLSRLSRPCRFAIVNVSPISRRLKTQFRLNIGREATLPPWRRAARPEPEPGGAEPGNPSPSINDVTSRPDQHGGSSDQPPGTAQQAVGATIPKIYDPRALSCCGNILWFEKCNTSEYAAGGHRPTRSDAAKRKLTLNDKFYHF